ncbi:RICIN domain-containing protein [Streptosporangium sp. NBC_01469]
MSLRLAVDPTQVAQVDRASQDDGATLSQQPWSGAENERWTAEPAGNGYYRFRSGNSGKCLNVQGGSTVDNAAVIQTACGTANDLWKFASKGIGYQVVSASGKCLNVSGGTEVGNPLIQYTCSANGATNDTWLAVWEPVTT